MLAKEQALHLLIRTLKSRSDGECDKQGLVAGNQQYDEETCSKCLLYRKALQQALGTNESEPSSQQKLLGDQVYIAFMRQAELIAVLEGHSFGGRRY